MARKTLMDAVAIPAAGTYATSPPVRLGSVAGLALHATFVYGSGGTTVKAYVQTSLDGGATWVDVASFAFATASLQKVSALTADIAPAAQAFTPADGALADNTVVNGVLGDLARVKYVVAGAYVGSTLAIHAITRAA